MSVGYPASVRCPEQWVGPDAESRVHEYPGAPSLPGTGGTHEGWL